jgi:hypothetical protein
MSSFCAESIAATMLDDVRHDARQRWFARRGGGTIMIVSGPRVAETRSQIVDKFLDSDNFTQAGWLVMVDSDMVFRPEDIRELLDCADREHRPIVGGLCFAGMTDDTMYPTVYSLGRDDDGRLEVGPVHDYPRVHRTVLLHMRQPHPTGFGTHQNGTPNPYPWFVEGHTDKHGRPFGEDISFCIRAQALGYPVHVHTGVKIRHHKSVFLDEALYDRRGGHVHDQRNSDQPDTAAVVPANA